jgi:hypothetical protein
LLIPAAIAGVVFFPSALIVAPLKGTIADIAYAVMEQQVVGCALVTFRRS